MSILDPLPVYLKVEGAQVLSGELSQRGDFRPQPTGRIHQLYTLPTLELPEIWSCGLDWSLLQAFYFAARL